MFVPIFYLLFDAISKNESPSVGELVQEKDSVSPASMSVALTTYNVVPTGLFSSTPNTPKLPCTLLNWGLSLISTKKEAQYL